ncbi:MAG TPA: hypothetical protein PKA53_09215 [Sphingobacterium sp.]|nr:hypothetical protein [Sphingobacterium sp.]
MPDWVTIGLIFLFLYLPARFSSAQEGNLSAGKSVLAFQYTDNEGVNADVYLHYTPTDNPDHYTAYLATDVCSDGLCKPVNITIQWDLLGRFSSYHTEEMYMLTKFDHIALTDEDHRQLHKILSDTTSVLRDYRVEDMIDSSAHVQSHQVVDAVTRATSVIFDGATVEGALYTVYTLWHFTNGPIRKRIFEHTRTLFSEPVAKHMLYSGNRDYVAFVFKNTSSAQRETFTADILNLIKDPDEYIPHFALGQLTDNMLSMPLWQHKLLDFLTVTSATVKNAVLSRLRDIKVDSVGLDKLLAVLPGLGGNQIGAVFSIVEKNKSQLSENNVKKIEALSQHADANIARHARNSLRKLK